MKQQEHQYVTGMVTGAMVALMTTLLSYWIVSAVEAGIGVSTMLLLLSGTGMLVGAAFSFLVSQSQEGPHFVLKKEAEVADQ